jgi:hypothetical protein
MTRRILIGACALALLAGCGSDDENEATSEGEIQIALTQQSGSAQTGVATLTEVNESTTRVDIDMTPAQGGESQPAHIHRGDCLRLEKQPEYPLESVMDGKSTSEVNAPVDELMGGGFAINVHKSDAEIDTYVACGEIASGSGAPEPDPAETETTEEQSGSGYGS